MSGSPGPSPPVAGSRGAGDHRRVASGARAIRPWAVTSGWPAGAHAVGATSRAVTFSHSSPAPSGSSGSVGRATATDAPGSSGGTSNSPEASGSPSASADQANTTSAESALCRRLRIVSTSATSIANGAATWANSCSEGVGVPSESTMPSITKLPSCTTSPKSPP